MVPHADPHPIQHRDPILLEHRVRVANVGAVTHDDGVADDHPAAVPAEAVPRV